MFRFIHQFLSKSNLFSKLSKTLIFLTFIFYNINTQKEKGSQNIKTFPDCSTDNSLSVAQGFEGGNSFQEIQIRPAYHTLTDRPDGLLRGSQINFLNTTVRYDDTRQQLSLHQLQLIDIASFSPWNALFHPFSYTIQTGINRNWNPKTNTYGYTYDLSGGTGITAELTRSLYTFIVGETGIHYGGFLPYSFGLNIGAKAGILGYFDHIQLLIEAERLFSNNWYLNQTNIRTQLTYSITQNWGLSATYQFQNIHPHSNNTFRIGIDYFF